MITKVNNEVKTSKMNYWFISEKINKIEFVIMPVITLNSSWGTIVINSNLKDKPLVNS